MTGKATAGDEEGEARVGMLLLAVMRGFVYVLYEAEEGGEPTLRCGSRQPNASHLHRMCGNHLFENFMFFRAASR